MEIHKRMGHPSMQTMIKAVKASSWLNTNLTPEQIRSAFTSTPCVICLMGKRNKAPIPASITDPTEVPIGHLVSGDIIGPITPPARDGAKYFFLFVDRRTSYYHAFTSRTKDGFITSLKSVYDFYLSHGHRIHVFRSDSENILVYGDVPEFLESKTVKQDLSLPYSHYQNLVERHVQTIVKSIATIMHDQVLLAASFWDYALWHLITLKNHSPNTKTNENTPESMVTGSPSVDLQRTFLFPFGAPVAVQVPRHEREWRFDVKSDLGIYLGQPKESVNGGLIYYPSTGAILIRADLIPLNIKQEEFQRYSSSRLNLKRDSIDESNLVIDVPDILNDNEKSSTVNDDQPVTNDNEKSSTVNDNHPVTNDIRKSSEKRNVTISNRKIKKMLKGIISTRSMSKLSALLIQGLVVRADELSLALTGDEQTNWSEALSKEINSLLHVTTTIVPEVPSGDHDVIYATVVLKKKMKDMNIVDKYKVRICACGNQLVAKTDYINETYSPTVSMMVHSSLLQLSIYDKMYTATFDTVAAYLYQEYPDHLKPLYLKLPAKVAKACGLDPNQLYRVKKYLYGLPDAGRAYYLAYSQHLLDNGYTKSASDPCLFMKIDPSRDLRTYIWFHVDDTLVSSTHKEELTIFENILKLKCKITADYDVTSHLGITLTRQDDGSLKLSQPKLLDQILKEYPSKSFNFPAREMNKQLEQSPEIERTPYLRLLGQLMYLSNSRPDILTALSYAATKSTEPTKNDFDRLLQIVGYLRQTSDYGLILYPRDKTESDDKEKDAFHLTAYVDAGYMSHPDASSHTGYTIALGSVKPKSFYYSKSVKQKLVATSSTHAEIRALYDLTINLVFIINLFKEMHRPIDLPAILYEDNQPAIDLVTNSTGRIGKSKHFLMLINFIREQVTSGLIKMEKVGTTDNISNVLTKIITGREFIRSFHEIMGISHNDDE